MRLHVANVDKCSLKTRWTSTVLAQIHNIRQDVPVEKVETMFEAAYEFGQPSRFRMISWALLAGPVSSAC